MSVVACTALTPFGDRTYIRLMLVLRLLFLSVPLLCSLACNGPRALPPGKNAQIIGPVSIRIHPTFTQVKNWDGDAKPDGIEALLEVLDRWDEPIRATGKVIFELYHYRPGYPDPRGDRLVNPWVVSLATIEEQSARWDRVSRAYKFQLAYPQIEANRTYVLTASFEAEGGRLFDQLNLGPERD
jgi:hypothetical protein